MASRLELHEELCTLLGTRNVYFQPPATVKMKYPCIRYSIDSAAQKHADNSTYGYMPQYMIQIIGNDPDTTLPRTLCEHFPRCRYDRRFIADNLYHDNLTLYY